MEDLERIKERLDNIRSIQPIITSLRTIAAGSNWRSPSSRRSNTSPALAPRSTAPLATRSPGAKGCARCSSKRQRRPFRWPRKS